MATKILAFVGTRPEAIKMAPVIRALQAKPGIECRLCVTGQHRELLRPVLDVFQLRPDFEFDVMTEDQPPAAVLAAVIHHSREVILQQAPDWVLVQGDTSTATAVALVAFLERVKLGHVEAGLRTFDRRQPFPEEVFRRVVDLVADCYFAPTERARQNLLREGCPEEAVHVTGNTVVDALHLIRDWLARSPPRSDNLPKAAQGKRIILATVHRRENFGEPLLRICDALRAIADDLDDTTHIVCTVHPNPNVSRVARRELAEHPQIILCPPMDYGPFITAMKKSFFILTDSGGVQEEAPALAKPVLVLRAETERPEAVEAGVAKLVGPDYERIVSESERLLQSPRAYASMAKGVSPYGDGAAAGRIAGILLRSMEQRRSAPGPAWPSRRRAGC